MPSASPQSFLVAAGLMVLGTASIGVWPLVDTSQMDRSAVVRPDPVIAFEADADAGPVVVRTSYSIPPEREAEFVSAMRRVRESRLRTGATQWGLFRDGEQPRNSRRSSSSPRGTSTCASTGNG